MVKEVGTLKYNSIFGVIWTIYLTLWLTGLFFFDRELVPDMSENISSAKLIDVNQKGVVKTVPFVLFSFMYTPNLPLVYRELKRHSYERMQVVTLGASAISVSIYILVSTFGYLGVVGQPTMLAKLFVKSNVLELGYNTWVFNIGILGLLFLLFNQKIIKT